MDYKLDGEALCLRTYEYHLHPSRPWKSVGMHDLDRHPRLTLRTRNTFPQQTGRFEGFLDPATRIPPTRDRCAVALSRIADAAACCLHYRLNLVEELWTWCRLWTLEGYPLVGFHVCSLLACHWWLLKLSVHCFAWWRCAYFRLQSMGRTLWGA